MESHFNLPLCRWLDLIIFSEYSDILEHSICRHKDKTTDLVKMLSECENCIGYRFIFSWITLFHILQVNPWGNIRRRDLIKPCESILTLMSLIAHLIPCAAWKLIHHFVLQSISVTQYMNHTYLQELLMLVSPALRGTRCLLLILYHCLREINNFSTEH